MLCALLAAATLLQEQDAAAAPAAAPPQEQVLYTLPEEQPVEGFQCFVSPDGTRWVGHLVGNDGTTVLLDGEEVGRRMYVNGPAWGAGSVAWTWGEPSGRRAEKWTLWQDGKESKPADWMGPPALDGDVPLYWSADGVTLDGQGVYEGGDYVVVRGKKKSNEEYKDAAMFGPPVALPGGQVAFAARHAKGHQVVVGKEEYGSYLWVSGMAVSADGKRAAWAAFGTAALDSKKDPLAGLGRGGGFGTGMIYTAGGKGDDKKSPSTHGGEYAAVAGPALGGTSGEHLAYLARHDAERGIVVVQDGSPLPGEWAAVGTPVFSPDGARLAYTVSTAAGPSTGPGRAFISTAWMDGATFAATGQVARDLSGRGATRGAGGEQVGGEEDGAGGSCALVVDGGEMGPTWERAIQPLWSPDGAHVAYRALDGEGWHVVCGDVVSAAYDEVGPPSWRLDGRLGFGARRGRDVLYVLLTPR